MFKLAFYVANRAVRSAAPDRGDLATPLRYGDFVLHVPTGPGIGIELDMDRVAFFRRDGYTLRVHSSRSTARF
jgi:L-alanine-DL-glutamate epimerase-like enolase superfamily enzyme